jgi:single-stranded-DNA-specific exonuclease
MTKQIVRYIDRNTLHSLEIRQKAIQSQLTSQGIPPLLAQLGADRGLTSAEHFNYNLSRLFAPQGLMNVDTAAQMLLKAIAQKQKLLVIADYDCDGATGCAVMVLGLRMMGAIVDYSVPNRFKHGYGLSPELVDDVACHPRMGKPDWIITVDNGIASVDGVEKANQLGIQVLITDHHLPGIKLPKAATIVNPNQDGCSFQSKSLAGVGVALYLLLAMRAIRRKTQPEQQDAPIQELLDLVALGTVADVVKLDHNNRILVNAGLERIRAGKCQHGIRALFEVSKRNWRQACASDLGFSIGPRINAAGRLQDITLGIECLLSNDASRAKELAEQLHSVNLQRRDIQQRMQEQADNAHAKDFNPSQKVLVVFNETWHEGLVGLVAGRLKEEHYRPCIAFAPSAADPQWLKGSGRSVAGVHLRDYLDLISKNSPLLNTERLPRFGGHAMAAGLTLHRDSLELFTQIAQQVAQATIADHLLSAVKYVDQSPAADMFTVETAELLLLQPWGPSFEEPLFKGKFRVQSQQVLQGRHSKLTLVPLTPISKISQKKIINAIFFGHSESISGDVILVYRLSIDQYNAAKSLQLIVEALL